ncbi:MAG: dihydrodipicolinate synthase family protein [Phycisphaeraceae bacterium]
MARPLDRTTYRGLWAAVPTPWTDAGRLDEPVLRRNCEKLAAAGADGIYTTDSDGEFYAIELDAFRALARVFGDTVAAAGVDAAMGVTWSHTRGTINRIKAACDAGVPNVHVALPFFMPLAPSDVDPFFEDLASAVPEARWIHYAHPRTAPPLRGADYARLAARHEQLIGTKLGTSDLTELADILLGSPDLAHSVVDPTMAPAMMLGAVGCCSYWFNTLPRWHRAYMDHCLAHRWDEAMACHRRLMGWELNHIRPLREKGYRHGILGKARGALSGFLEDSGRTQPPYRPVPASLQRSLREAFAAYWAGELEQERAPAST